MAGKLTLSVSQLNEYVRRMFQLDPMLTRVDLKGEISNLKFHQSGMLFFTLKDDGAAIDCAMSESDVFRLQAEPFEGMRAVVTGSVSLYTRTGRYQFYASSVRADGVGALYEQLLALKSKLSGEGLFAQERKRPIPCFQDTIGVVSSPTGAVIHDICNVAYRRDPQARILLCPARVQGVGAAEEIVRAIEMLEQMDSVSVIIVARGGGSMEDLWVFNSEPVVRAISRCSKPVISAIGHETDVTLSDLAADLRAPTPSAAAECAVPVRKEMEKGLRALREQLDRSAADMLLSAGANLKVLTARLDALNPQMGLIRGRERLDEAKRRLRETMLRRLDEIGNDLRQKENAINLLSPYAVLSRGYAIVMKNGCAQTGTEGLCEGDELEIRFADGKVKSRVIGGTDEPDRREEKP